MICVFYFPMQNWFGTWDFTPLSSKRIFRGCGFPPPQKQNLDLWQFSSFRLVCVMFVRWSIVSRWVTIIGWKAAERSVASNTLLLEDWTEVNHIIRPQSLHGKTMLTSFFPSFWPKNWSPEMVRSLYSLFTKPLFKEKTNKAPKKVTRWKKMVNLWFSFGALIFGSCRCPDPEDNPYQHVKVGDLSSNPN